MSTRVPGDSEPPSDDRRRALREQAFVLAEVTCPSGKVRLGAIDDASAAGVGLLLHTRVEVGDRLKVAIEMEDDEPLLVEGEVVRRKDVSRDGPWRYKVGLKIEPPSEALQAKAARIRERQEEAWRARRPGESSSGV